MLKIKVLKSGVEVQTLDVSLDGNSKNLLFGRDEKCDVRLNDRSVGREHALLHLQSGDFSIQKKSKFGRLFINGLEKSDASLKIGDIISIGDYQIQLSNENKGTIDIPASGTFTAQVGSLEETKQLEVTDAKPQENGPAVSVNLSPETNQTSPEIQSSFQGIAQEGLPEMQGASQIAIAEPGESDPSSKSPGGASEGSSSENSVQVDLASSSLDTPGLKTPGLELPPDQQGFEASDSKTVALSTGVLVAKLVFQPEQANITELEINKDVVTVGRGSDCDAILTDKKASRRHCEIKRSGVSFFLKDLESGNGTSVNGKKITSEVQLAGEDVIKVGDSEFTFKATNQSYFENENEFMPVSLEAISDEAISEASSNDFNPIDMNSINNQQVQLQQPLGSSIEYHGASQSQGLSQQQTTPPLGTNLSNQSGHSGFNFTGSIPGMSKGSSKKETLVEKFKRQSLPRKIMIVGSILIVLILGIPPEEKKNSTVKKDTKSPQRNAASVTSAPSSSGVTFKSLPEEKKQFIINTYQLAFDLYKNKQYERALYEINKLLQILPDGYKDAKDIKIYSEKAVEQLKAIAEEKRRQEEQERIGQEISEYIKQARDFMESNQDQEARNAISEILQRDPENATALRFNQMLDEKEKRLKEEKEQQKVEEFKREKLQQLIDTGERLFSEGKYYEVMDRMQEAPNIGLNEPTLLDRAKELIIRAKNTLAEKVKPHLNEAEAAMQAQDLPRARDAYYKAIEIDYKNKRAKQGLDMIRDVLHARAKQIYIQAIIAESVSDYRSAKQKFKECMEIAMSDDVYYGRCSRKYKKFEFLDQNGEIAPSEQFPSATESTDEFSGESASDYEEPQFEFPDEEENL